VPYIEISRVELADAMRDEVRCYYRWGAYGFSLVLVIVGIWLIL